VCIYISVTCIPVYERYILMQFQATTKITFPTTEADGEKNGWVLRGETHAKAGKKVFVLLTKLRQKPKRTGSFIRHSARIMMHKGRIRNEINSVKYSRNPSIYQVTLQATCHEYVCWKLIMNCSSLQPRSSGILRVIY
jgi:hypothetical protein